MDNKIRGTAALAAIVLLILVAAGAYTLGRRFNEASRSAVSYGEVPASSLSAGNVQPGDTSGSAPVQTAGITVTSPAANVVWNFGSMQTIRWEYSPAFAQKIASGGIIAWTLDVQEAGRTNWASHISRLDAAMYTPADFQAIKSFSWKVGDSGCGPGGFCQVEGADEALKMVPGKKYTIRVCGGTFNTFYAFCGTSQSFMAQ